MSQAAQHINVTMTETEDLHRRVRIFIGISIALRRTATHTGVCKCMQQLVHRGSLPSVDQMRAPSPVLISSVCLGVKAIIERPYFLFVTRSACV